MKRLNISVGKWSIIAVLFFPAIVLAATTVGTNLSTTGTFTTTNTGTSAVQFQNAAGTTTGLKFDTSNSRLLIGKSGSVPLTTLEVGGTASVSGIVNLGDGRIRPNLDATTAFRLQNAAGTTSVFTLDSTNTRVLIGKSGSVPLTTLEVGGTASVSGVATFATDIVAGGTTASSSTIYQGEFTSTGTTSVNFGGSSTTQGTCLQMKNTAGGNVYVRVIGTTLTVTAIKCHL